MCACVCCAHCGQAAFEMLLSGELIDAHTALQQGLITRVVEHDELAETTMRFARQVARPKARHAPAVRSVSFTMHMCALAEAQARINAHTGTRRGACTHIHVLASAQACGYEIVGVPLKRSLKKAFQNKQTNKQAVQT